MHRTGNDLDVGRQFSQIGSRTIWFRIALKVDAGFVNGIGTNAGSQLFLEGLTSIAKALGCDGATGPAIKDIVTAN